MNDKAKQREELKTLRAQLNIEDVLLKSEEICDKLFASVDWMSVHDVHLYLPIEEKNEVSTWPLLDKIWTLKEAKSVFTSVYGANKAMRHVRITKDTEYDKDELGIPTPVANYTQKQTDCDLIIVPTLGFDESLNRLGYGRGVYDTFLSQQTGAKKVGLAYEISKLSNIESETHDVMLDAVVTEVKLYD